MHIYEVFRRRLEHLNSGMVLAFPLAILIMFIDNFANGVASTTDTATTSKVPRPILDVKRRNDLVDEAFLEQKDILLSMLENKLKEVRDKKRKKADRPEANTVEGNKCDFLPNNVDLKLKSNGIVGIGETDLQLRFGESDNNTLDLNATGISNVGKINMKLGVGDGKLQIPGLKDLFYGSPFLKGPCESQNKLESNKQNNKTDVIPTEINRRSLELSSDNITESSSSTTENTITEVDLKSDDTLQTAQESVTENTTLDTENFDETAQI